MTGQTILTTLGTANAVATLAFTIAQLMDRVAKDNTEPPISVSPLDASGAGEPMPRRATSSA